MPGYLVAFVRLISSFVCMASLEQCLSLGALHGQVPSTKITSNYLSVSFWMHSFGCIWHLLLTSL